MIDAFQVMKWPLVACVFLPGILIYFGLHIVQRGIIFVDLALAQIAALGHCLAILLGYDAHDWQTFAMALGSTVAGAGFFAVTRTHRQRVPQEALIGIIYVVAAAAALLMLSKTAEGKEELQRTLVGEVLVVRPMEVGKTLGLYALIALVHFVFRKQFLLITFEPDRARQEGLAVRRWDFLFYLLFGLVVTSFVHIGGVLLVFSYLIVPAVCGVFLSETLMSRLFIGWAVSVLASILGLFGSYQFDLPTGAAVVCALGLALLITGVAARWRAT
ncbi:MAG: iron chelate uptake ABC transporter family permease subunit [Verrucomicrobiota bacterium]|jgi:zinc/manganese transport system permease protein